MEPTILIMKSSNNLFVLRGLFASKRKILLEDSIIKIFIIGYTHHVDLIKQMNYECLWKFHKASYQCSSANDQLTCHCEIAIQ